MARLRREFKIGPFSGGLNTRDDPQLLRDNELSAASNVIIDMDGSIKPRPSYRTTSDILGVGGGPDVYRMLGNYDNILVFSRETYTATVSVWACRMGSFDDDFPEAGASPFSNTYNTGIPVLTATEGRIVKSIPYAESLLHIHENGVVRLQNITSDLFYDFADITGNIPGGVPLANPNAVMVWKDRLFYAGINGNIYYSAATDAVNFNSPGGGYFRVGSEPANDTFDTNITSLVVQGDVMYIFKEKSTFAFTFQTDPATDGYLRLITPDAGAIFTAQWKGRIFTVDYYHVSEFSNNRYIDIGSKVLQSFNSGVVSTRIPISMFAFNDMLIVRYYGSREGYTMNLLNGAWSKWTSVNANIDIVQPVVIQAQDWDVNDHAYKYVIGVSGNGDTYPVFSSNINGSYMDRWAGKFVVPDYIATTKEFDLGSPWSFKRIYKVMVDRSFTINESTSGLLAENRNGGWYVTIDNEVLSSLVDSPSVAFGSLVNVSPFRCRTFKLKFQFGYSNQSSSYASFELGTYKFSINGYNVHVGVGSDVISATESP